MKSRGCLILSALASLSLVLAACGGAATPTALATEPATQAPPAQPPTAVPWLAPEGALVSHPSDAAPVVDGNASDASWADAPELVLDISTFGIDPFQMRIRSVYTADTVYFLFQYPDDNMEVDRGTWAFDSTTRAWSRLSDDYGDEDEFGLWWNMTMPNYSQAGCFQACHGDSMLAPSGTNADDWRWNSVRSNVIGWVRDFVMTDNPEADPSGGFTKDEGYDVNRGYVDNVQELNGVEVPAYWKPFSGSGGVSVGDPRYLLQAEIDSGVARAIVGFDPATGTLTDEDGTTLPSWVRIPGYILSDPSGPSWNNISGRGQWLNGVWTVEWARALETGYADDIQFADRSASYYFDGYIKTRQIGESAHGYIPTTMFVFEPMP